MKSITYTAAGKIASTINRVCEDNAPVVITRNRDQAVVTPPSEYDRRNGALYASPENAKRLRSIEQLECGQGVRRVAARRENLSSRTRVGGLSPLARKIHKR